MSRELVINNSGVAVALAWIVAATAQTSIQPETGSSNAPLVIALRSLGVVGGTMDANAFAATLGKLGVAAQPAADQVASDWRRPPAGIEPDQWVSVITVGFGAGAGLSAQAEAYAFIFGEPGKRLVRLGHVPYRQINHNSSAWTWVPPTVPLAGALRAALATAPDPARPVLGLKVIAGKAESGRLPDEGGGDGAIHADMASRGLKPIEAMAWAAAF